MSKARWPEEYKWDIGSDAGKVCRSADGRIVLHMKLRYGAPETWNVLIMVYGPGGRADERQGWFEFTTVEKFDDAVTRAKTTVQAAGLIESEVN